MTTSKRAEAVRTGDVVRFRPVARRNALTIDVTNVTHADDSDRIDLWGYRARIASDGLVTWGEPHIFRATLGQDVEVLRRSEDRS